MVSTFYIDVGNCQYCKKKATTVFVRRAFLSFNLRMFCDDCQRFHARVRDDTDANHR